VEKYSDSFRCVTWPCSFAGDSKFLTNHLPPSSVQKVVAGSSETCLTTYETTGVRTQNLRS